jgi:endonuclease/exonuclease/phosphatase (EEP) superfamily protein YafD
VQRRRLGSLIDLVAIVLPAVVAGVAMLTVLIGVVAGPVFALPGVVAVVAGVLWWRWPRRHIAAAAPVDGVRLVAVNLRFDNADPGGAVADALAQRPDVLVVSELTEATRALIRPAFACEVVLEGSLDVSGHAVYADVPLERLPRPPLAGQVLHVRVGGAVPFELYAAHLPRPTFDKRPPRNKIRFTGHRSQVTGLAGLVVERDAVVAGDLNLCDRTTGYHRLVRGRVDAMRTGRARRTFVGAGGWRWLDLRIDHVVLPAGWCAAESRTFALRGSDHLGVATLVGPASR